jgi:hypothetical protein
MVVALVSLVWMGGPVTTDRPPPPDVATGHGGRGGGWSLLCTTKDLYEAQIIRGALEQGGIVAVMIEPVQLIGSWMLPTGHERIPQRIMVLTTELDQARLLLMDADADAEVPDMHEREAVTVRRMGSADRILRWAIAIAIAGLLLRALLTAVSGVFG